MKTLLGLDKYKGNAVQYPIEIGTDAPTKTTKHKSNKLETMTATRNTDDGINNFIQTIEDFERLISHPYRSGEYFYNEDGDVFSVPDDKGDVQYLLDVHEGLYYSVLWEGEPLIDEDGIEIQPVYQ